MARKIIWSDESLKDLENIAEFIEKDSYYYAASFVLKIVNSVETLSEHAERGRTVPEFKINEIKEIFINEYRIIYKIKSEEVIIITLVHGRRDLDKLI
ncbi:hypothetical protein BH10BAC5_BH10BAC5_02630 [soil metagenome]